MRICLTVTRVRGESGEQSSRYVFDQDEVLVGRDEAVEVRLPDPAVSLVHLRLRRKQGRLFVLDGGSRNGTWLEGHRLQSGVPTELRPGMRLALGSFVLSLEEPDREQPLTAPDDTARLARQMVLEVLGALGGRHPFLEVASGPQQGVRLEVPAGPPLLIGRGEECALRLKDADASRRHLEVSRQGDRVQVRDLESKNGLQHNEKRLAGSCLLQDGDRLLVGRTQLRFLDPTERYLAELSAAAPPEPEAAAAVSTPGPLPEAEPAPGPRLGLDPSPQRPVSPPGSAAAADSRSLQLLLWGAALLLVAGLAALVYVLVLA